MTRAHQLELSWDVLAIGPVQRKISRVKSGALPFIQPYLSDGTKVQEVSGLGSIHDKGYIVMRSFTTRSGFYFSGDPTATVSTDDYSFVVRRAVINKMIRIATDVYINELDDEILVTDDGKLHPGLISDWEGKIENQIEELMVVPKNLSGFSAYINPDQNVISSNKVIVKLRPIPVGYSSEIEIILGFVNPSLN